MHVALAGVGALGQHILRGILATEKHSVTILTRGEPRFNDPRVTWRKVDFTDKSSLVEALRGVETCISTGSSFDDKAFAEGQMTLVEACIAAGVRRFVPSEFEFDPYSRKDRYDYLISKRKVLSFLQTPAIREKIRCTIFTPGIFYDYYSPRTEKGHLSSESLVDIGFDVVVNLTDCRAELVDGMDEKMMRFTAVADVGRFVAKALDLEEWPEQFRMHGANISCIELVRLCERVRGKPFEIERLSLEDVERKYEEAKKANDMIGMFKWTIPACILGGEVGWEDDTAHGVDMRDVFPDEKFEGLEEFLRKWW
ncbi:hypothetical protein FQN52_004176 [Onygenales sp. PD_12]|nr:hypothetical protein FQN52_004176 [Onygenales sp. PD_12]